MTLNRSRDVMLILARVLAGLTVLRSMALFLHDASRRPNSNAHLLSPISACLAVFYGAIQLPGELVNYSLNRPNDLVRRRLFPPINDS